MVSSRIEAPFVAFEAAVADKRMDEYSLRHEELVKQTVGAETFGYKTARDAVHFLLYSDAWRQAFAAAVSLSNDATLDHIEMAHDYQDQVTFAQEQLAQRNPHIFDAFSTLEQYRTPTAHLIHLSKCAHMVAWSCRQRTRLRSPILMKVSMA